MKNTLLFILIWLGSLSLCRAQSVPEFSTAGFYELEQSGRTVFSMNPAWRFYKGAVIGAEIPDFDDALWEVVSLPHGIEYVPTEASGCINYQGEVWYRKHFTPDNSLKGKKLFLHFEAIMGKSKVYVNGTPLASHFGGYLPVVLDVTEYIRWDQDNVVSVWADNSNDPMYPPGKAQDVLDFTYFGGIYRDCWLIAHRPVYISHSDYENQVAGGGLFVSFGAVSNQLAEVHLKAHLRNDGTSSFGGSLAYEWQSPDGQVVQTATQKVSVKAADAGYFEHTLHVKNPHLWAPDDPTLYQLVVKVLDKKGKVVDGFRQKVGIRSFEFKGADGFWLNGTPYPEPLMGANRHQDFAVVGNAVANSMHWRDAKKLRDVGLKVIRNAHCPQDPAFMDACDQLGLLVIVNTPGWQFWNEDPLFEQRVYDDIRHLVRRDRNHPCVWMWEPILNETYYPQDFAQNTVDIVNQEYPYPYCYCSSDSEARGKEAFPILFSHPNLPTQTNYNPQPEIAYYTREWGDNVDNWTSHNSPSRVARNWGEVPMLIQAKHYANPEYPYTCYNAFYGISRQHIGGCLWHSFDHQRGYHPDPFYGGIMDVFRQPKYSYYMFMAQRSPLSQPDRPYLTGPMVYIAHEMTPFSPKDVTVYSNCEQVRLTYTKEGTPRIYTKATQDVQVGMPSPIVVFKDVFDFMRDKALTRAQQADQVYLLAEGLIDGQVVATHKVYPARRPTKLLLWVDDEGTSLQADGSDFVTVIAAVADEHGNIKRLNNYSIQFSVEGEGRLLGTREIGANPTPVKWGTAPVLVQSTLTPGTITLTARVLYEGSQMPVSATLTLESTSPAHPLVFAPQEAALLDTSPTDYLPDASRMDNLPNASRTDLTREQRENQAARLKEVEQQQEAFGEHK